MPHLFVSLDKLPTTDNLKVDRKKLPPIVPSRMAQSDFEEPKTDVERKVADVWSKLLGVVQISRNDQFFELGGDSLLR